MGFRSIVNGILDMIDDQLDQLIYCKYFNDLFSIIMNNNIIYKNTVVSKTVYAIITQSI